VAFSGITTKAGVFPKIYRAEPTKACLPTGRAGDPEDINSTEAYGISPKGSCKMSHSNNARLLALPNCVLIESLWSIRNTIANRNRKPKDPKNYIPS